MRRVSVFGSTGSVGIAAWPVGTTIDQEGRWEHSLQLADADCALAGLRVVAELMLAAERTRQNGAPEEYLGDRVMEGLKMACVALTAQVTERFLEYYQAGKMPVWEVPNMITKYYTNIKAREFALK